MIIHDGRKKETNKRPFNLVLFYHNNRKTMKKIIMIGIIIAILFFPLWSGELIGNWIKDFIGTILNIIQTI